MIPSAEPLRFREKLAYGLGDTAANFFYHLFNLFLLYYYTDIVGLPAAAVGSMFLLTRIVDAVKNPVMGVIADRTRSRWGKFRPYLLYGALPYGICGYLMFLNPAFGPSGKLIYAYATFTLVTIAYAVVNVPYAALMGVMSPVSSERTSLASYRFFFAFAGGLVISSCVIPMKNYLGHGDEAAGFRLTAAVLAFGAVVLLLCTFAYTRERVTPPPGQDRALGPDLKALLKNTPWMMLFLVAVGSLTLFAVRNAATMYYFKYYVGSERQAAVFMTLGMVGQIAGCACTPFFLRYVARKKLLVILFLGIAPLLAAFYFIPPKALWVMGALHFGISFLIGPKPVITWSMYADTADFAEWRFGRRCTALIFSAVNFANGLGLAIGGAVSGWALTWAGFVPNAVQTESALHGIRLMFTVFPAVLAIFSAGAAALYPLTEAKVLQIEADLAARKAVPPSPVPQSL
ncbi:MFS transporter [Opitutaceae bacterium EW11]|nr:MFS transporter [Opitutaceae bacterium EW11]